MVSEHLQDLRGAINKAVAMPEYSVAVKEPGVILVQQVGVMFACAKAGGHRKIIGGGRARSVCGKGIAYRDLVSVSGGWERWG